ncbi:MAG TPA: hypothetical protein VFY32_14805 [Solirubrobacteraceae bacterium]|nr:hypothetical protein [Solirubrobacteraceae bacterium]
MVIGRKLLAALLIALMAIGSILLWLGIPVGWLYLVSRLVKSSQPSMGPYVLLIVGIPASMIIVGKALSKLNRVYGEVTGTTPTMRARSPWMKSMRGERESGRERTVLDIVMVWSVALALLCFGVWFFAFAGSSLPS